MTIKTKLFMTNAHNQDNMGFKADNVWHAIAKIESAYKCEVVGVYKTLRNEHWILNTVTADGKKEDYHLNFDSKVDIDMVKDRKHPTKKLI